MSDSYYRSVLENKVGEISEKDSTMGGGFAPGIARLDEHINDEAEEDGQDEECLPRRRTPYTKIGTCRRIL